MRAPLIELPDIRVRARCAASPGKMADDMDDELRKFLNEVRLRVSRITERVASFNCVAVHGSGVVRIEIAGGRTSAVRSISGLVVAGASAPQTQISSQRGLLA